MTDDNRNLPRWERAFDEYAKNNAPDLLPGILQKINASQKKKPFYLRKNVLRVATGLVAAGILIGLLLLIPDSLTAQKRCADSGDITDAYSVSPTNAPLPTNAASDDTPFPRKDDELGKDYYKVTSLVPFKREGKSASEPADNPNDSRFQTIELTNVTIGDMLESQTDCFYLLLVDGVESDSILLHWSEAVPGTQYKSLILSPVSFTATYNGVDYQIRDVISAE